jgi:hypothetical protein
VIQTAELLENFCVCRVLLQDTLVRLFCRDELVQGAKGIRSPVRQSAAKIFPAHILLLLVDVADLKPDVDLGERTWRIVEDVAEAL